MTIRKVRVGGIASLRRARVHVIPAETYEEIGVRSFGRGIFHKAPVKGAIIGGKRVFEIHPGDLILSNVFAWEGAIAVAGSRESGKIGSHRFLTYEIDPANAESRYLSYFFVSEVGLPLIREASPGAAGRNRTLGIQAFESLSIPLPDIAEQRRIASWLDHLHKRRREAAERTEFAATWTNALRDALCIVDAPLERVGDKLSLVRESIKIDPSESYSQIGIFSFGRGVIRYPQVHGSKLSKLRYFEIPPEALLLSNIQAWEGAIAVSDKDETGYVGSNRFLSYVPISDVDTNYLRYFFLSSHGHPLIQRASPGTTVRNRTLGTEAFENLKIPLPDVAEQRRIANILDKAYEALRRMEEREKMLDALLASALNQAFRDLR
jgi:type I restriction enzyme S subunit